MKQYSPLQNIGIVAASTATLLGGAALTLVAPRVAQAQAATQPNVTVEVKEASLRDTLENVFRATKVDFSIDPNVRGSVSLSVKDLPLDDALKMIRRASTVPFTYTKEKGVYFVKPGAASTAGAATPTVKPVALPNVTLDLQDAPIRGALEQIFRSAKVDFGIDPTVQGYVNLIVTDIPFENALRLVLRSSTTPLTYSVENGVYLVRPRTVASADPLPPAVFAQETETRTPVKYDRIELTYADPADLAKLLNITMIPIFTRFGLNVPGASGIVTPGGAGRNGGTPPGPGAPPPGGGNNGGTGIGSPGPGGGTIIGL
jgi:type II secretory pathway component HofQ